ncbi:MAG: ATP-binding protein [Maribacter sp.]|uniref:ATP-binding response regulator n=1 Tax=Maribacter sp. TaxID=1897614 RepID=UPI003C70E624
MDKSKNKFTIKIVLSYLLLIVLAITASFYIFSEIQDYIATESTEENDNKLMKTSAFLTKLYEAENLSKLVLQSREKKNFITYSEKIDSIYNDIETLKNLSDSNYQTQLLDSLSLLLQKKVTNNNALRLLKAKNQTSKSIANALNEFDKMEASLGIITAESLAPNLSELSPKAQETIHKVARYLNENIPSKEADIDRAKKVDSVLQVSKALLKEVEEDNLTNENTVAQQELKINKTDLELTQQLRNIISSFEKEVFLRSINDNINREAALKRSIHLAGIAAILGFFVVGIFTFIINRDFWKANLYRQKLEKEKKYSESLLQSREQLITTVSHDLRTPLNTISGYSEIIEKSGLTDKQIEYFDHIKSASTYVNNLVNDLLDFSRLEAGKMNIEKVPFNLSQLLTETAEDLAAQYKHKDLSLNTRIDPALDQNIVGDPFRLRQIITNLLGNAYKFTHEGSITVEADWVKKSTFGDLIRIRIKDTGIGIGKEKQQLIFKEFTQAEDTTEKKYGGYGLGLTISKKLLELLGGNLTLESTVGSGSTFTVELPVEFEPIQINSNTVSQRAGLENGFRILILDDDTSFIQMVGEMLKSEHFEPVLYTDFNDVPKTGLAYDVVLTDIEMPAITGFEVLAKLKTGEYGHYTNQPIIAMTGRRDLTEQLSLSHGFHRILQKPFSKTELLKTLRSIQSGNKNVQNTMPPISLDTEALNSPYCLKTLISFLGEDEKSLNEVLQTFMTDTRDNMQQLKTVAEQRDFIETQKVAHRMLPMFRQLKVKACVILLEDLEISKADSVDLKKTHETLQFNVDKLLRALKKREIKHPNYID